MALSSELGLGPGQTLVSFDLSGNLDVHVRKLGDDTYHFVISLPDASFSKSSTGNQTDFSQLAAELRAPFGFTVEAGRLKAVEVNPSWTSFAASIARTVASVFQLPRAPNSATASWMSNEVDTTGEYIAEYAAVDGGYSKKKVKYEELSLRGLQFGNLKTNLSPAVVGSSGRLLFTQAGSLRTCSYSEQIVTPMGATAKLTSNTKLSLELNDTRPQPDFGWEAALAGTKRLDATAQFVGSIQADYDDLKTGDYTYAKALAELHQQANADDDLPPRADEGKEKEADERKQQERLQAHGRVFRAMTAILRTKPEHIDDAVAVIRKKTDVSRVLIDALASANTAQTMAALVSLLNDEALDMDWRGASARGLIRVSHASPESVAALTAILDEPMLRVHAYYGLGSIARRLLEEGKPREAEAVVKTLVGHLRSASSATQVAQLLRGISNAGLPSALPSVQPHLGSASESVRAAAVSALRLMKDPRVDALLIEALLNDPKKSVRRAAAEAVDLRESSEVLIVGLQNAVTSDPDVKVRRQVLATLIKWLPDHPELRSALALVAKDDKRPSVRRSAGAAVANFSSPDKAP